MKLKVIAKYSDGRASDLILSKEKMTKVHGEIFTIENEERAKEILNTKFQGSPVVMLVTENKKQNHTK